MLNKTSTNLPGLFLVFIFQSSTVKEAKITKMSDVGAIGNWYNLVSSCLVCLIGFYPQGPRKGIFVSSKAHASPPTHILSNQGDPLVARLES